MNVLDSSRLEATPARISSAGRFYWRKYLPLTLTAVPLSTLLVRGSIEISGGAIVIKQIHGIADFVARADPGTEHIVACVGSQIALVFFSLAVTANVLYSLLIWRKSAVPAVFACCSALVFSCITYLIVFNVWEGVAIAACRAMFFYRPQGIDPALLHGMAAGLVLSEIATVLSFTCLALAASCIAYRVQGVPCYASCAERAPAETSELAGDAADLRTLVLLGSAVLFVGLADLHTTIAWRASLLDEPSAVHAENLGRIIALIWVTVWTVCLLLVYLPCAMMIRAKVDFCFRRSPEYGGSNRAKWLEDHDLRFGMSDFFVRVFALFGPLVTTAIPPLVDIARLWSA